MRIDRDGYRFASPFLAAAVILILITAVAGDWSPAGWPGVAALVVAGCILAFFRDPGRTGPDDPRAVISSADGIVVDVGDACADGFEGGRALRIAVFMSVFNVHVNRAPAEGMVTGTVHRPGKKLSAFNARAADENEHGDTDLDTPHGTVRIRQIAGLIARRVVTRVTSSNRLDRGDRIGLIRFGSRVDVFLPAGALPAVKRGDRVRAGETVIARFSANEKERI